jgi:Na+-translocating ferredoxin:NAD+ oxidoreductase subunit G
MKKVLHIIATLTLIGVISGGILSQFNAWALPMIAENQRAATERAIFLVQPDTERYELLEAGEFEVYHVFDAQDRPLGYALVHAGDGFQSSIKLVIGLKEDLTTITGIEVLDMNETPGLGTLINEEPFKGQFRGLSAVPNITWIKGAAPTAPNQVQVISGATISARAVVDIVNESLEELRRLEGYQP